MKSSDRVSRLITGTLIVYYLFLSFIYLSFIQMNDNLFGFQFYYLINKKKIQLKLINNLAMFFPFGSTAKLNNSLTFI